MVIQIGLKIEQKLLEQFRKFAKENGTNLSALMRQATILFIKQSNTPVNIDYQLNGRTVNQEEAPHGKAA